MLSQAPIDEKIETRSAEHRPQVPLAQSDAQIRAAIDAQPAEASVVLHRPILDVEQFRRSRPLGAVGTR